MQGQEGPSKSQIHNKKKRILQSVASSLQKDTIVHLGEESTVQKRESSKTRGELSDVTSKLDNNRLLNIAQSATLDADIAMRTAGNLVGKIHRLHSQSVGATTVYVWLDCQLLSIFY
jgi:hypothetical protein